MKEKTKSPRPIVALAGCGYWGKLYLDKLLKSPHFKLAGLLETNPKTRAGLKKQLPKLLVFGDFDRLIKKIKPKAVFIVTPPKAHYRLAEKCLQNGISLLLEKPPALSLKELKDLFLLAEKNKLVLFPALIYLFHPLVKYLKAVLKSGFLGKLQFFSFNRSHLGPARKEINAFWDLGLHDLTILLSILNKQPAKISPFFKTPGTVKVLLEYSGGGGRAPGNYLFLLAIPLLFKRALSGRGKRRHFLR